MIEYDMHIHSMFSDGTLTPEELFDAAAAAGLKGISITDHDTADAVQTCVALAASGKYALDFIPGIELSTEYNNQEIHVLGYMMDYNNSELQGKLDSFKSERYDRILKMIQRMNELGYELTLEDVLIASGSKINSLGRPHIARALINKGYFRSVNEVFSKLLGTGKPGYVDRFKISTSDGIKLIRSFRGIPVLAHPGLIKLNFDSLNNLVSKLVKDGLLGIEIFHSDHTVETSLMLTKLVNRYNLLVTGGSDYHSPNAGRDITIGCKGVTSFDIDKMKKLHASIS